MFRLPRSLRKIRYSYEKENLRSRIRDLSLVGIVFTIIFFSLASFFDIEFLRLIGIIPSTLLVIFTPLALFLDWAEDKDIKENGEYPEYTSNKIWEEHASEEWLAERDRHDRGY